ncbi:MAG TPA: hypothetical protein VFK22_00460 [Candidatus Dormibacteraeota bacterium]|nr:hypothetical protein [Candidatus Dormibacteraeota bacterium]
MKPWDIDDMLRRERDAVAQSNATIRRSRETVARSHELIDNNKALIARARKRPSRAT